MQPRQGFTLIELIVVIAIIAVLAAGIILTVNPAQLFKQARDSARLSDIVMIKKALAVYQTELSSASIGTSSVVYVSLPDTSSTCANLGLPSLGSGWTYQCVSTSTLRKTDGTGWMPINLTAAPSGSSFSQLPVDPVNTTSSGTYYTFTVSGTNQYAVTAGLESRKYIAASGLSDGGVDPARYETGSDVSLAALQSGLIGYWKFDEGSGTTVADASATGANGTWNGSGTHWTTAGKVGGAGSFDGSTDFVLTSSNAALSASSGTLALWIKALPTQYAGGTFMMMVGNSSSYQDFLMGAAGETYLQGVGTGAANIGVTPALNDNQWHHLVGTWSGAGAAFYVDGALFNTAAGNFARGLPNPSSVQLSGYFLPAQYRFNGLMDEARIYGRVLSANEVALLYAATR